MVVLVYRVLPGTAPNYLGLGPLLQIVDMPGRRALRPASTSQLFVPSVRPSTVGPRTFAVAGPQIWNSLPADITTIDILTAFQRRLETHSFHHSYPNVAL
jgi:hypothetical protein